MQARNLNKKKFPFVSKDGERITAECFLFFHFNDGIQFALKESHGGRRTCKFARVYMSPNKNNEINGGRGCKLRESRQVQIG